MGQYGKGHNSNLNNHTHHLWILGVDQVWVICDKLSMALLYQNVVDVDIVFTRGVTQTEGHHTILQVRKFSNIT